MGTFYGLCIIPHETFLRQETPALLLNLAEIVSIKQNGSMKNFKVY